jgi:hypothetical protein
LYRSSEAEASDRDGESGRSWLQVTEVMEKVIDRELVRGERGGRGGEEVERGEKREEEEAGEAAPPTSSA